MIGFWSLVAPCRGVGLFAGLSLIKGLQHQFHDIRPVELVAEPRGREEVRLLGPATVDVPTDHVPHRRAKPCNTRSASMPPSAWRVHGRNSAKSSCPVRPAIPADGPVAVGRDDDATISAQIDAPSCPGARLAPVPFSVRIEDSQEKLRTEHENPARSFRMASERETSILSNAIGWPRSFGLRLFIQSVTTGKPATVAGLRLSGLASLSVPAARSKDTGRSGAEA